MRASSMHRSSDKSVAWSFFHDLVLLVPCGPETGASFPEVEHAIRAHHERVGARIGIVLYVDLAAEIPSDDVRKKIAALNDRLVPYVAAMAQVAPGSGFRSAALRAVVTSINMLQRKPFPRKVFGEVEPALVWLQTLLRRNAWDARDVAAKMATLASCEAGFRERHLGTMRPED